jgi:hypothetical protein
MSNILDLNPKIKSKQFKEANESARENGFDGCNDCMTTRGSAGDEADVNLFIDEDLVTIDRGDEE